MKYLFISLHQSHLKEGFSFLVLKNTTLVSERSNVHCSVGFFSRDRCKRGALFWKHFDLLMSVGYFLNSYRVSQEER